MPLKIGQVCSKYTVFFFSEHFWNATTTKIKNLQSLSTIYGNDLINHDRNGPAFFNDIEIYR